MNISRAFILLVIGILLFFTVAMILPYLQFFLLAVLLAFMLMPIHNRLEPRVGSSIAAGLVVLFATVAVLIPLILVVRLTIGEATSLFQDIQDGEVDLESMEAEIESVTGMEVDILSQVQGIVATIEVGNVVGVIDAIFHTIIGLMLTLFLLYYFMKDADKLLAWLHETIPLTEKRRDRLFSELDQIMKAVLVGHMLVAVVQGGLAGIGLLVMGVPRPILWTVVMILLSLLPIVGSFLIWGPAALYLFLQGEAVFAVGLVLWGAIVVGVSDDYLRPIIVDRYAEVNPAVILIGVLGGISVFGVMGIFFGPLIIGILRSTIEVFREEFNVSE